MGGVGSGRYRWRQRATTVEECWVLALRTVGGSPTFVLSVPGQDVEPAHVACPGHVALTTTRPHFGGVRWLFRCPAVHEGASCNRRVARLYAMNCDAAPFACRQCHGLTYRSCQQTHRWAGLARQIVRLRR